MLEGHLHVVVDLLGQLSCGGEDECYDPVRQLISIEEFLDVL